MVEDKDSQLKNLETEKIIKEKAPGAQAAEEGKVEGAVLRPEKEKSPEIQPVERQKILDETERFENGQSGGLAGASVSVSGQELKEREKKIEKILETGLEDIYLSLPADKQREFTKEGEKTMKEINTLLDKVKINIGKIVSLIKKWLSLIPGVNKFFLEQEAKIKADEIMKLKER